MNKTIEVLDAIMSSGKTQSIIKWMLERPQYNYIYISPLLSEVTDRIPSECAALGFVSPNTEEHRTKASHLLELLKDGHNVSFTHSLFENLTKEHLAQIQKNDYVLIIDEEIDFIEPYRGRDYSSEDLLTLEASGHVRVNTDSLGRVEWTWKDGLYKGGSYQKLKNMCDIEMLHCAKSNRQMMVTHLPISLITSSKRCIVMTYLFSNSIMARFMEMKGITVKPFTEVVPMYTEAEVKKRAADKIEFILNPSMRKLKGYNLSSQWYIHNATKEQLSKVQNAILNVSRKAEDKSTVMFTFPKDMLPGVTKRTRRDVRVHGFIDESSETYWVYCGTKATNQYDYKDTLIHGVNRYCVPAVSGYLRDYGFPVKEDEYALSEMIQWIWRSAIRKPEGKIRLAILSERMRRIFNAWLDGDDDLLE